MLKALEDLIIYLIENWRSLTVQGALTAVVLIIVKRIGIQQLKRLLRLKDNADLERIESKLDLLIKERGIEWSSPPHGSKRVRIPNIGSYFSCSQVEKKSVSQLRRMKRMLKKLGSRKFWALVAAVVTSCMVLFGYSEDTTLRIVALITNVGAVVVYLLVEGGIDKAREEGEIIDETAATTQPNEPTVYRSNK